MTTMTDTCSTCRFWVATTHGECHRFPPLMVPSPTSGRIATVWPETRASEGCGEHRLVDHLAALQGPRGEATATNPGT